MKRNFKIILITVLVLIVIGGVLYFEYENTHEKKIKVGEAYFTIPEGYHLGDANINNDTNLTDEEYNSIFIKECNTTNISDIINVYEDSVLEKNLTTVNSNYSIDGINVYKVFVNNTYTTHYWFEKGNKVYEIYTWDQNTKMDNIVSNLISST